MRKLKGTFLTLLTQQSGQIQLLIVAPILTLSFLSLVVRTASSAVDSSVEKKKVTEQLKRRLNEVQNEQLTLRIEEQKSSPSKAIPIVTLPPSFETKETKNADTAQQEVVPTPLQLTAPSQPTPSSLAQQLLLPLQASIKVEKKMTLSSILENEKVEKEESQGWLSAAKKRQVMQKLTPGRTLELFFTLNEQADDRTLSSLAYELDKRSRLILEKHPNGKITSRTEKRSTTLVWKGIGGRISGSLYKSAIKAGVPRQLIDDIADLDWDIELASDLRQGDPFKVIFEEFQLDGKPIEIGGLVAAEISNRGKTYTLFSFPEPQNITVPVQGSGKTGTFLRYPLKFTRITSVFTDARLHPILERVRPHTGVDFAAPRGTPIRSIADGKITFAGRQSGYGIMVRIDHPGPYDSAYAHLDRIAADVKEGRTIEKGQVLGFVGSTGLATGPHLHFEMYKDGKFINPLTAKVSTVENFQKKENPTFLVKKKQALDQLSAMKVEDQPIVLSRIMSEKADAQNLAAKGKDDRLAMATPDSLSLIPGLSATTKNAAQKKTSIAKSFSRSKSNKSRVQSSKKAKSYRSRRTARQ